MFYFHPYLGKIPSLTNIFQMGWNQLGQGSTYSHPMDFDEPIFKDGPK